MDRITLANNYHDNGFNCAQSVFAAFGDITGIDEKTALKIAGGFGGGVKVLPGVTIGDNVVIGAGSIVTKDLPSNVVAVGNPCRVLREVGEHDRIYYYKDRKIDWEKV